MSKERTEGELGQVVPAEGVRIGWEDVPAEVRARVEGWLGSRIVAARSQRGGFSPGAAARVATADGRRVFIKAVGPELNPDSVRMHRRERMIAEALPTATPAARLLWADEDAASGWVTLVLEDVNGHQPAVPWRPEELARVVAAMTELAAALTPSPLDHETASDVSTSGIVGGGHWARLRERAADRLDRWSARNLDRLVALEAVSAEAVAGESLVHLDIRADNVLLTPERVVFVDWTHARLGAPWVDLLGFLPSVAMQGSVDGPLDPEAVLQTYEPARNADPGAIDAALAGIAGYFTWQALKPPPPGLPTVRAFQDAQGIVTRRWLARRLAARS